MHERKKLADIVQGSNRDRLERTWSTTTAATDPAPIPEGAYRCLLSKLDLFTSRTGTPGVKLMLEVLDGEHAGRRVWHDIWLTEAALPMAKRDLMKLGITSLWQMDRPLPSKFILDAKVALRHEDDGREYNRLKTFAVVAIEPIEADPFAPGATRGDAWEPGDDEQEAAH